jgi:hypothetical protein
VPLTVGKPASGPPEHLGYPSAAARELGSREWPGWMCTGMCKYVCMCTCIRACVHWGYVCVCACARAYVCVCALGLCVCVCMCTCIRVCVCALGLRVCVCMCMCTCIRVCVCACWGYVCVCVHEPVHTCVVHALGIYVSSTLVLEKAANCLEVYLMLSHWHGPALLIVSFDTLSCPDT